MLGRAGVVKLWPAGSQLVVGEGIETVLAAATRIPYAAPADAGLGCSVDQEDGRVADCAGRAASLLAGRQRCQPAGSDGGWLA